MGHKPVRIAKWYRFRGVTAQDIRWRNYKVWRMELKQGSVRGPRCPRCRRREPAFRDLLCYRCYYASTRRGPAIGPRHPCWKGGITLTEKDKRLGHEYRKFRAAVLKRDEYRCVSCGVAEADGAKLEVDHIIPQVARPDMAFDVSNARTLCDVCHRKTPTYGNGAKYWRYLERQGRKGQ